MGQGVANQVGPLHMTGRAGADMDHMLSDRPMAEVGVEGRHAGDRSRRNLGQLRKPAAEPLVADSDNGPESTGESESPLPAHPPRGRRSDRRMRGRVQAWRRCQVSGVGCRVSGVGVSVGSGQWAVKMVARIPEDLSRKALASGGRGIEFCVQNKGKVATLTRIFTLICCVTTKSLPGSVSLAIRPQRMNNSLVKLLVFLARQALHHCDDRVRNPS